MSSPYSVQVHQKEPSINSSYSYSSGASSGYASSSSGTSTPSTYAPGQYREFGATKHLTSISSSGKNLVINHHKRDYELAAPHPSYSGGYNRTD